MPTRSRGPVLASALGTCLLLSGGTATAALPAAAPAAAPASEAGGSLARVCAYGQMATAGLGPWGPERPYIPIDNVVHPTMDAFVAAKPEVRPLRTEQFVSRDGQGRAVQIRCKGKSADHISTVHGAGTASGEGTCAAVNRTTLRAVTAALTPAERAAAAFDPSEVVVDEDTQAMTGGEWTQESPSTAVQDGVLHLKSSSLLVEWLDPRWQDLPEAFRGIHYCTLIAPGELRRVLLGGQG
ncbi:hypothetical protein [Actinomadura sp. 7K507]|uniref:hypothetical protein n=1 Tax=Actinomadura sp. 7K507 TaxID=2530365 RepID=UPI00104840DB|nr:hypothetical protein [Actinomadura sp. 7K507]TDC75874.1 hypothetical protein E1285_40670 [Actinomadura sp. 7K507]